MQLRGRFLPEFLDLRQSSVDLIAHGGDDIVDRDQILFVDQSLTPDFGIDLIASLKMLADVIFLLGDAGQLLASMDVHPGLGLTKLRSAEGKKGVRTVVTG